MQGEHSGDQREQSELTTRKILILKIHYLTKTLPTRTKKQTKRKNIEIKYRLH